MRSRVVVASGLILLLGVAGAGGVILDPMQWFEPKTEMTPPSSPTVTTSGVALTPEPTVPADLDRDAEPGSESDMEFEETTLRNGTQLLQALGVELSIAEVGCEDIQIWESAKPGDRLAGGLIRKSGWGFCPSSGINIYIYVDSSLRDEAVETAGESGFFGFAVIMDTVAVFVPDGPSPSEVAEAVNGQVVPL